MKELHAKLKLCICEDDKKSLSRERIKSVCSSMVVVYDFFVTFVFC